MADCICTGCSANCRPWRSSGKLGRPALFLSVQPAAARDLNPKKHLGSRGLGLVAAGVGQGLLGHSTKSLTCLCAPSRFTRYCSAHGDVESAEHEADGTQISDEESEELAKYIGADSQRLSQGSLA